jgi:hypothetical protein
MSQDNQDTKQDPQAGLSDEEFACLLFRSTGANINGIFRDPNHKLTCGFCKGVYHVA